MEPEDCGFRVEHFSGLKKLALELEHIDKQGRLFHTTRERRKITIGISPQSLSWKVSK